MARWDPRRDRMPEISDMDSLRKHMRQKYALKEWMDPSVKFNGGTGYSESSGRERRASSARDEPPKRYLEDLFDASTASTANNGPPARRLQDEEIKSRERERTEAAGRDQRREERDERRRSKATFTQELKRFGAKAPAASTDLLGMVPGDDDAFFKLMQSRVSSIPARSPPADQMNYHRVPDVIYIEEEEEPKRSNAKMGVGSLEIYRHESDSDNENYAPRRRASTVAGPPSRPQYGYNTSGTNMTPSQNNPFLSMANAEATGQAPSRQQILHLPPMMSGAPGLALPAPQNLLMLDGTPNASMSTSMVPLASSQAGYISSTSALTQAFPSLPPYNTPMAPMPTDPYARSQQRAWTVNLGTQSGINPSTGTQAVATTSFAPGANPYDVSGMNAALPTVTRTTTTAVPLAPSKSAQVQLMDTGDWTANIANVRALGATGTHIALNRVTTQASSAPRTDHTNVSLLDTGDWSAQVHPSGPGNVNVGLNRTTVASGNASYYATQPNTSYTNPTW